MAGPDAVSAVLMHDAVLNEYVTASSLNAYTNWVVTMPTKRQYIKNGPGSNAGKLFQSNFNSTLGSCDDVVVALLRPRRARDRRSRFLAAPAREAMRCAGKRTSSRSAAGTCSVRSTTANIDSPYGTGWAKHRVQAPFASTSDEHAPADQCPFVQVGSAPGTRQPTPACR